jgi:hypothetical protein
VNGPILNVQDKGLAAKDVWCRWVYFAPGPVNKEQVLSLLNRHQHRGPDDSGFFYHHNGRVRLDRAAGKTVVIRPQPLDGRILAYEVAIQSQAFNWRDCNANPAVV